MYNKTLFQHMDIEAHTDMSINFIYVVKSAPKIRNINFYKHL